MNDVVNILPGYRVCEYMLILNPSEDIRDKVTAIREEFNKDYRIKSIPNRPNLMLASFSQFSMMEERIINKLKVIAMAQYPFKIEMKNFGSFPSHTIYIAVTTKLPIQDLIKKIRTSTQSLMKLEDNKPYFHLEPHMNIATKLVPWQYEKGWLEYSNKHFTGRFIASEMLLLKRYEGDKTWQVARRFEFQNLPIEIKQGELF